MKNELGIKLENIRKFERRRRERLKKEMRKWTFNRKIKDKGEQSNVHWQ